MSTERQDLVVGGFTEARTGGGALGALLLGVYEGDALAYAGKVGTGFTAAGARELRARLDRLARATSPFARGGPAGADARAARWVRPDVVVEVEFTEWTSDGRLRHPVFQGVRLDRAAAEVVRERPAPAPIDTPPPPRPPSRRAGTRRAALPGARQRGRPRR
jgi:bifunctional non-homologous end joining protein LigD